MGLPEKFCYQARTSPRRVDFSAGRHFPARGAGSPETRALAVEVIKPLDEICNGDQDANDAGDDKRHTKDEFHLCLCHCFILGDAIIAGFFGGVERADKEFPACDDFENVPFLIRVVFVVSVHMGSFYLHIWGLGVPLGG
jgi:hypothetical protein